MIEDTEKPKIIAPAYVSYKTFRNFLETLSSKGGCPARIDYSVLPTMSGANQKHLMSSLKFLKLIDGERNASEQLRDLIEKDDEKRKLVLRDVVKDAYSFLLEDDFVKRATTQQVETKFRDFGVTGDTISKGIMFFTHIAKDADIDISQFIQPYKGKRRSTDNKPRKNNNKSKVIKDSAEEKLKILKIQQQEPKIEPKKDIWIEQLLSKFPVFNPEWSSEVQGKWFESFEKLMRIKEDNK